MSNQTGSHLDVFLRSIEFFLALIVLLFQPAAIKLIHLNLFLLKQTGLALVVFLAASKCFCQSPDDMLDHLRQKITREIPQEKCARLYVFTNKSIFTPKEYIWSSFYLFDTVARSPQHDGLTHAVFISLIDRFKKKAILSKRFLLTDNFGTGAIFLPDSIPDGNYVLTAFTDLTLDKCPEVIFKKDIFIRSLRKTPYQIIPFSDYNKNAGSEDSLRLKFLISTPEKGIASGVNVSYSLYADTMLQARSSIRTNKTGELYIAQPVRQNLKFKEWQLMIKIGKDSNAVCKIFSLPRNAENAEKKEILALHKEDDSDSMMININGVAANKSYFLFIHDEKDIQFSCELFLKKSAAVLKFPIDSFPPGNLIAVLFDDENQKLDEKPLFLPNRNIRVEMTTDTVVYGFKSKVRVKLKCSDRQGRPIQGAFSMSSALNRRMIENSRDIRHFYYPGQSNQIDVAVPGVSADFQGQVMDFNRRMKKSRPMMITTSQGVHTFSTDKTGGFEIKRHMMVSDPETSITISIADLVNPLYQEYSFQLTEPDLQVHQKLAERFWPLGEAPPELTDAIFTNEEKSTWNSMLKTVVVTAKAGYYYGSLPPGEYEPCNVWVCGCGHYMCNACPPNSVPERGKYYKDMAGREIRFEGCEGSMGTTTMQAITRSRDFEPPDLSDTTTAVLESTLYWNPYLVLDKNGEASASFYTDDLAGKFCITVEGVTNWGPFSSRRTFDVR